MPLPAEFKNEQRRHKEVIEHALKEITREVESIRRDLENGYPHLGDGARHLAAEAGRLAERAGAWDALKQIESIVLHPEP